MHISASSLYLLGLESMSSLTLNPKIVANSSADSLFYAAIKLQEELENGEIETEVDSVATEHDFNEDLDDLGDDEEVAPKIVRKEN